MWLRQRSPHRQVNPFRDRTRSHGDRAETFALLLRLPALESLLVALAQVWIGALGDEPGKDGPSALQIRYALPAAPRLGLALFLIVSLLLRSKTVLLLFGQPGPQTRLRALAHQIGDDPGAQLQPGFPF